ncbi:hypothetical protein AAES_146258 [Amazona aestiva]|uniref:Uncharacterized protein n=1 Tax=Amazona aestiva TaxID=12930 RepID=A0A0Q3UQL7_AMAAE|nr:hypothetical protein AAES_146258 [Amazona aestiva]
MVGGKKEEKNEEEEMAAAELQAPRSVEVRGRDVTSSSSSSSDSHTNNYWSDAVLGGGQAPRPMEPCAKTFAQLRLRAK